jgi:methylated-DNA-[protein]-cysteine S-methyltransferase
MRLVARLVCVETRIGTCGLVWIEEVILRVVLSKFDDLPAAVSAGHAPGSVLGVLTRLARHIDGAADDFQDVVLPLDLCSAFARRVYEETRRVPPGERWTYGELARRMGIPGSARAVGSALRRNPWPILVPSHRVVSVRGRNSDDGSEPLCARLRRFGIP